MATKLNAKRALLASWKEGAIMERERGRIFLAAVQGDGLVKRAAGLQRADVERRVDRAQQDSFVVKLCALRNRPSWLSDISRMK